MPWPPLARGGSHHRGSTTTHRRRRPNGVTPPRREVEGRPTSGREVDREADRGTGDGEARPHRQAAAAIVEVGPEQPVGVGAEQLRGGCR